MKLEMIEELPSEDLDRIVINREGKRVKIVLEDGRRILVDYNEIHYVE